MTPELVVGLVSTGAALLSAGATGGVVYGLLRADVTRMANDMTSIKQALGLEPSDGEIKTAFLPRAECLMREEAVGGRLDVCEDQLKDHEHRLTAAETRIEPGA